MKTRLRGKLYGHSIEHIHCQLIKHCCHMPTIYNSKHKFVKNENYWLTKDGIIRMHINIIDIGSLLKLFSQILNY